MWTEDYTMPCVWYPITDVKAIDPVTGKEVVVDSFFDTSIPYPILTGYPHLAGYPRLGRPYSMRSPYLFAGYGGMLNSPWDWGVCHAGGWIRWQHHYVWVAGNERHHQPPVRWVKSGRQVGFVPIHPKDTEGKPPINMKDGIIVPLKKPNSILAKRTNVVENKPVVLLSQAPKQYRTTALELLKIAQAPHAEAYSAFTLTPVRMGETASTFASSRTIVGSAKGESAMEIPLSMERHGTPLTFDHKSQSFMVSNPVLQNGRSITAEVQVGGRIGSVQANGNGSSMMRISGNSSIERNNGVQTRPATTGGSATSAASSTRAYTPIQPNTAPARAYTPTSAPAYIQSQPARSYTPPPAATYTPPPAPVYSPPPAPVYSPPPAPAYNPPSAPSNSGGSIRK